MRNARGEITLFDNLIASLIGLGMFFVGIGILLIIFYYLFYPMFKGLVNKVWEIIDRIKEKLEEKVDEEAW